MGFMKESNRMRHFGAGVFLAFFGTVLLAIIGGLYKEVKDKSNGGKFDWLDWLATIIGGFVGTLWPALAVFIYFKDGELLNAILCYAATPAFIIVWMSVMEPGTLKKQISIILGLNG